MGLVTSKKSYTNSNRRHREDCCYLSFVFRLSDPFYNPPKRKKKKRRHNCFI